MEPVDIVRSAYDAVRRRDIEALLAIFAEDCEFRDMTEHTAQRGHAQFARYMQATWEAFPDFAPDQAEFVTSGNSVAAELILKGTHRGEFLGMMPSRQLVHWNAAAFYTIDPARQQIIREVYYYDTAMLREALESAHGRNWESSARGEVPSEIDK